MQTDIEQPVRPIEAGDIRTASDGGGSSAPICYASFPGVQIYLGDSSEIVRHLRGIHAVVTSPPYNQQIDKFSPSGMHKESRWVEKISAGYADSMDETEYQSWQVELLNRIFDATDETASCFYNHKIRWRDGEMIIPMDWLRRTKWKMRQEIIWARNGSCTMNARMFAPSDERIYWLRKETHKWNQDAVSFMSVWQLASKPDPEHPCAYPIQIPQRCIAAVTNPGDTVLDPYMGSGTTGVACVKMERKFVGIEKDERYAELAAKRIQREQSQGRLL
jgi:site-specific DNA-methyltransferase (adenine-specific)